MMGPSQSTLTSRNQNFTRIQSSSESETSSHSQSEVPVFVPVFGTQVTSTHFWSLEELKHMSKQELIALNNREGMVKLAGTHVPIQITTAPIDTIVPHSKEVLEYRAERLSHFPFVLPFAEAEAKLSPDVCASSSASDDDDDIPVPKAVPKRKVITTKADVGKEKT